MTAPLRMHADEVRVDESVVRALLSSQMPDLAYLPLSTVEPWGTDHAIWRLGEQLVVRFPRIHWAVGQVDFEATWLPILGPQLPVAVPQPVAVGQAGGDYPYAWAVHRWLPGQPAALDQMDDPVRFALDLAAVVRSLQSVSPSGAPAAKNRARPLTEYDRATRHCIASAGHLIDAEAALEVWEEALAAPPFDRDPVWAHGDLEGNCLIQTGRLSGLLDWGSACAGDPAVDVQVVWSPLFNDVSRQAFLDTLGIDHATELRSRGAAINQACAALPYYLHTYPAIVERSWHKLAALGVGRQ